MLKQEFNIFHHFLGDLVCIYSALIYIEKVLGRKVVVYTNQYNKDVADLYEKCSNIQHIYVPNPVKPSLPSVMSAFKYHRTKDNALKHNNYVGTYLAGFGVKFVGYPPVICPDIPKHKIEGGKYVLLQPKSVYLSQHDLGRDMLQQIVDKIRAKGYRVVVGGKPDTSPILKDVDYVLGDPFKFFSVIRGASYVLTPRSASAHIAAGYGIPSIVWAPTDGENWHLDYPSWKKIVCTQGPEQIKKQINILMGD